MKTILVTGSNGLLGQKLTEAILADNQFKLVATGLGKNRFTTIDGYEYAEMDVLDPVSVKEVIARFQPDAVIHTAAMTNVDKCETEQELAYQLNVGSVKTLIDSCTVHNIQLIHLSTDFIFDGASGPYSEVDAPNPLSYYGATKLEAEEILKNSKCKWAVLRTIIVYGIISDHSRSNIILWAKEQLEKGSPISVVDDQWRMPTLAEDLAACCLLAVEKDAHGVFNASGKDMMRISELVFKVADFWKLDKSLITEVSAASLNQAAKRPVRTGFILDKAINELGYAPHTFEQGLEIVAAQLAKREI